MAISSKFNSFFTHPRYLITASLHFPYSPTPARSTLVGAVDLGDVGQEVEDAARVAPLVVVPRDDLDEVVVERDTGLGVEDGRVVVAHHVGGDDVVLGVLEDAWEQSQSLFHTQVW